MESLVGTKVNLPAPPQGMKRIWSECVTTLDPITDQYVINPELSSWNWEPEDEPEAKCMPPVIAAVASVLVAIGVPGAVTAGVATGLAATIATSLVVSGIMMGANVLISHLIPHPSAKQDPVTQQVNIKQPISYRGVIYGTRRLGGVITYVGISGGSNEYLHVVLTLAGHEVNQIGNMYFNDTLVTISSDGHTPPAGFPYNGLVYIQKHTGDPNDTSQPFPQLAANMPSYWTSNHLQRGCAKVHIRLKWDATQFANGVPTFTFDVQGKKLFDPRTSTTTFSANPALCLRDFLTDSTYGMKSTFNAEADTYCMAAANICDESVLLRAGGSQPRYQCNGGFSMDQARGDVIKALLTSMAGIVVPPGATWKMSAGAYYAPAMSLTDSDLRGPIKYDARVSRRDLCNAVHGTYVSAQNNWQPSDFPPYQSSGYVSEDGGDVIWEDVAWQYETDPVRAQRLAKIALEKSRRKNTLVLPVKLVGFPLEPGDTFTFTHSRWGLNNATFLVATAALIKEGDVDKPYLGYDITAFPIDSGVYLWNPNTDECTVIPITAPPLPDILGVAAPGSLALLSDSTTVLTMADGRKHPRILVGWTPPLDQSVLAGGSIQVFLKKHSDSIYLFDGNADGADSNYYIKTVLADSTQYDVKLVAVNSAGAHSVAITATVTTSVAVSTFTGVVGTATYSNGQLIDALRPAEAGAEVTTGKSIDILTDGIYVRNAQMSSTIVLDNANFEASASLPVPGWTAIGGCTPGYIAGGNQQSGNRSLWLGTTGQGAGVISNRRWRVSPGDQFKLSAWLASDGSATAGCQIKCYGASGNFVANIAQISRAAAGWAFYSATGTVPAGTVYVTVSCEQITAINGGVGFDNIQPVRIASMDDEIAEGSTYGKTLTSRLSGGKPVIDFSEGIHTNKVIDYLGDGTYGKTRAGQLQDGLVAGRSVGKNCCPNPSFESRILGKDNSWQATVNSSFTDDWKIRYNSSGIFRMALDASCHTGTTCALVQLSPTAALANGANTDGGIQTTLPQPVRPGDTYTISGWVKLGRNAVAPAGVTISVSLAAAFLNNGSWITGPVAYATTYDGNWYFLTVTGTVPSSGVDSVIVYCGVNVANSSGGTVNAGGNVWVEARFDDLMLVNNSSLDTEIVEGLIFGRTRQGQLQNGVVTGISYGKNLCPNPGFENNVGNLPINTWLYGYSNISDDWVFGENDGGIYVPQVCTSGARPAGGRFLEFGTDYGPTIPNNGNTYWAVARTKSLTCRPGDAYLISGYVKLFGAFPSGMSGSARFQLTFRSNAGVEIAWVSTPDPTADGQWYYRTVTAVAPANAVSFTIDCLLGVRNTSGANITFGASANAYGGYDDIVVTHVSDLSNEVKGTLTSTKNQVPLQSTIYATTSGTSPLSQSGTSTMVNVASFTIQIGSNTVTYNSGSVSGLSYAKWYFYTDDPTWQGGAVTYHATTDPNVLTQNDGRIYIGYVTLAAGGGGGGGGGALCPMEGTEIEPLGNLPCTRNLVDWFDWVAITTEDGYSLTGVPEHQVYCDRGKIAMKDLTTEDLVVTKLGSSRVTSVESFQKAARKIATMMPEGHLYWANGILSHNLKPGG